MITENLCKRNQHCNITIQQPINRQRTCARVTVVTFSMYVCVCLSVSQTDSEDVFPNGHHSTACDDLKVLNVGFFI